jgi:hypothetical protein
MPGGYRVQVQNSHRIWIFDYYLSTNMAEWAFLVCGQIFHIDKNWSSNRTGLEKFRNERIGRKICCARGAGSVLLGRSLIQRGDIFSSCLITDVTPHRHLTRGESGIDKNHSPLVKIGHTANRSERNDCMPLLALWEAPGHQRNDNRAGGRHSRRWPSTRQE